MDVKQSLRLATALPVAVLGLVLAAGAACQRTDDGGKGSGAPGARQIVAVYPGARLGGS